LNSSTFSTKVSWSASRPGIILANCIHTVFSHNEISILCDK
jgi:hypothetical protein